MHAETFLRELAPLANGPGCIQMLRELVLQLALTGRLLNGENAQPSWREYRIEEVVECYTGNSISAAEKSQKYTRLDEGLDYIATKDVEGWHGGIDYASGVKIPYGEPKFKIAPKGSVLICAEGGSAGRKIGVLEKDVNFGNKLICCVPDPKTVAQMFLFRVFQSSQFHNAFKGEMTGIIGGISLSKFKSLSVRVPGIETQHEIAAKIDELMVLCDALEARKAEETELKRAVSASILNQITEARTPTQIDEFLSLLSQHFGDLFDDVETIKGVRGAALDLAISGLFRCVKEPDIIGEEPEFKIIDTRTNEPISIDTKAVANEHPFPIPRHWQWWKLSDLTNPSKPISYGVIKLGSDTKGGIPTLRCSDVKYRRIALNSVKMISPEIEQQYLRTRLLGGEILVNIRGTLGGCAVVPKSIAGYNVAREVAVVDPNSAISPEFLLAVFSSPYFQSRVDSNLKGIAYKGLNLGTLANFPIPLPPLAEQKQIVAKVDELMELCDRLDEQVHKGERLNTALMASLVHTLTETDPDGGGALEPADFAENAPPSVAPDTANSTAGHTAETKAAFATSPTQPKSRLVSPRALGVDTKFQEAVLVAAIVNAFFGKSSEPVGNFRLQKAVYFARRKMGEHVSEMAYLKKAAGPYNPSMKYSGGIAIAKQKKWLREARGRFGFGHLPGPDVGEAAEWIDTYSFRDPACWVVDHFRYKKNEEWETLATVDYAIEHLQAFGIEPDASQILQYVRADDEWRPKIDKLNLTEMLIGTAMLEVRTLFGGGPADGTI